MQRFLGIVIMLVGAFMLSGCGSIPTTIVSSDGKVSIDLSSITLPSGVSMKDIRIEPISTSDEGLQAGVVYDLLPDGVDFDGPVTVTMTLPREGDLLIPWVMHSTADGTEVVENVKMTDDIAAGTLTIEAKIRHFSKIWTTNHGFRVTSEGSGEYPVGGSVPIKVTVTPTGSDVGIWNADKKRYYGADIKADTLYSIADIGALSTNNKPGPLSPDKVTIPGKKDLPLSEWAVFYGSMFCDEAGEDSVQVSLGIDYTIEYYPDRWYAANTVAKKQTSAGTTSYFLKNSYTCADDMMVPVVPYLFICPNGWPSRSGTYLTDATTGEPITNAAGEKLDSITGQPIPPCS